MLGLCALELGRAADAVAHLEQALSLPELPAEQRMPLRYDAGRAYAALGDSVRARAAFEEVRVADPSFGDLERELAALEAPATHAERGAAEASREAYESFDDLLSDGPTPAPPARYESFDDLFTDEPNDGASETAFERVESQTAEPEPDTRSDAEPEIVETCEEPAAAAAPPTSAQPRRRRKISFV
jgi:tetratricopeptide (TPR) repeat protein